MFFIFGSLMKFYCKIKKTKYIASVGVNASLNASEFQNTSLNLTYIYREKIISLDINNKYKKENNTRLLNHEFFLSLFSIFFLEKSVVLFQFFCIT